MSDVDATVLLSGPRGRRLCLAIAHRLHTPVWPSLLQAADAPDDIRRRAAIIDHLHQVDATQLSTWQDPTRFVPSVAETVDAAMYWQEPDEEDLIADSPEIIDALGEIADAICSSPAAAWWSAPVDLERLRYTDRYDVSHRDEPPRPPQLGDAATKLAAWYAGADRRTGRWWSGPSEQELLSTTRPLPALGSTELVWEEDSLGHPSARVWSLTATAPRVYEINSPAAWTSLVERYPLDVTHSRREQWQRVTGLDGPWLIPNYQAVADDWDGVHLTVACYLATATRALPIAGRGRTLLGGWNPETTWWLTDDLELAAPEPDLWHRNRHDQDEVTWDPADPRTESGSAL